MKDQNQEVLTVGVFMEAMNLINGKFERIDARFEAIDIRFEVLETKMMQGFDAFDKRMNIMEKNLSRDIKTLSNQVQHLALAKADWPEKA
jgi:hypothetical protein